MEVRSAFVSVVLPNPRSQGCQRVGEHRSNPSMKKRVLAFHSIEIGRSWFLQAAISKFSSLSAPIASTVGHSSNVVVTLFDARLPEINVASSGPLNVELPSLNVELPFAATSKQLNVALSFKLFKEEAPNVALSDLVTADDAPLPTEQREERIKVARNSQSPAGYAADEEMFHPADVRPTNFFLWKWLQSRGSGSKYSSTSISGSSECSYK